MKNIAIITVCYNDYENLKRTLKSIRIHKKQFHKYYVIDGGSKDLTIDIIKNNLDLVDDYISEPDKGIYDAMNKVNRFNISPETFLFWLNAGDELLDFPETELNNCTKHECSFFPIITKNDLKDKLEKLIFPVIITPINEKNFYPKTIYMHQGFLVRYSIFNKYRYDLNIGIQAENLLMAKCIAENSFYISDCPISIFYKDGISNTKHWQVLRSYFKVANELKYSIIKLIYYKYFFLLKLLIKSIIPLSLTRLIQHIK